MRRSFFPYLPRRQADDCLTELRWLTTAPKRHASALEKALDRAVPVFDFDYARLVRPQIQAMPPTQVFEQAQTRPKSVKPPSARQVPERKATPSERIAGLPPRLDTQRHSTNEGLGDLLPGAAHDAVESLTGDAHLF